MKARPVNKILRALRLVADIAVPRFIREDVALAYRDGDPRAADSYDIVCIAADLRPGEVPDAMATADSFTWLNVGITWRLSNLRVRRARCTEQ